MNPVDVGVEQGVAASPPIHGGYPGGVVLPATEDTTATSNKSKLQKLLNERLATSEKLVALDVEINKQLVACADVATRGLAEVEKKRKAQQQEHAAEEGRRDNVRRRLMRHQVDQSTKVSLNVGGQVFQTTRATLTEGDAAGSFIAELFNQGTWTRDGAEIVSSNGEVIFFDRDPGRFGYVLEWLREGDPAGLPESASQRLLLYKEAVFYNLATLQDALKGWRQRQFALSEDNRKILDDENEIRKRLVKQPQDRASLDSLNLLADNLLIDVFAEKGSFVLQVSPPPADEQLSILVDKRVAADPRVEIAVDELNNLNPRRMSSICSSLPEFLDVTFRFFTMATLQDLDWRNVLVAGGSVLGALLPLPDELRKNHFPAGYYPGMLLEARAGEDLVDHYHAAKCDHVSLTFQELSDSLWKTERDGLQYKYRKTREILDHDDASRFKSSDIDIFLYGLTADEAERKIEHILAVLGDSVKHVIRTEHCITFVRHGWPHRNVQVILRLYRSKAEVLIGFDLDCCAVGFDGEKVYALPRFRRAMNRRYNLVGIDPTRQGHSFKRRVYKYAIRGFALGHPGMNCLRLKPESLDDAMQEAFQADMNVVRGNMFNKVLSEVGGLANVLLMERLDNMKQGGVYVSNGFARKLGRSANNEIDREDEGSDSDYAPDFLNPYQISPLKRKDLIGPMIFALHQKNVKQFIIERARSGLPIDQASVNTVDVTVPFIWKRTDGVILQPRSGTLATRLIAARAALEDVFLSPEHREYYVEGHNWSAEHRRHRVSINYVVEEGGQPATFECELDVKYTLAPDFPRRLTFMAGWGA